MARPSLLLPMALALLALCLLALPRDARARPGDRKVGELQELSPNDPQVQKAAQVAVANYNMGSNSDYYYRDITILRAHSQVRGGRAGPGKGRRRRGEGVRSRRGRGGGEASAAPAGPQMEGATKSNQGGILIQQFSKSN